MTYPDTTAQVPAPPQAPAPSLAPVITVIEPEVLAPLGRLGGWLLAEGATIRMVRPGAGDAVPSLEEVGDALVVLGGAMSAHDEAAHPWITPLRGLLARVVAEGVPAVAICLGAQIAAEALGGVTAVPAPGNDEMGVVELTVTEEGRRDPVFSGLVAQGVRAARRAGVPTRDGRVLPVIVSHHDAVTRLPEQAVLLASSDRSPVHAWRAGNLLAFQHHPESDPSRVGYWRTRDALTGLGLPLDLAVAQAAGVAQVTTVASGQASDATSAAPGQADQTTSTARQGGPTESSYLAAIETGRRAREQAEAVDPVIQAFGRALARSLVHSARQAAPLTQQAPPVTQQQ